MFTGLVETLAEVVEVRPVPPGQRLTINAPSLAADARVGDSICVSGCCLTVVSLADGRMSFDAGPETLARTNLGELTASSRVNLERSLRFGDRLGGHLVTGHVDGLGVVDRRDDMGEWSTAWFLPPEALLPQIVSKGSIAVDGVSLTVVDVVAGRFSVQLIPHTLAVTTLGGRRPGDRVNLETDLLAKYVQRQMQAWNREGSQ
jgi:riboflavin synthase